MQNKKELRKNKKIKVVTARLNDLPQGETEVTFFTGSTELGGFTCPTKQLNSIKPYDLGEQLFYDLLDLSPEASLIRAFVSFALAIKSMLPENQDVTPLIVADIDNLVGSAAEIVDLNFDDAAVATDEDDAVDALPTIAEVPKGTLLN